jgi:hypothetical protein
MAGLLSRFTTFLPNTTILSNDHNQELNRLVNLLNGTTTNLKTVLKTSDAGDPPLEVDQLGAGPILKLLQGGILKAQFRNTGGLWTPGIYDTNDNEELLFVATGSAVNEFTITNAATGNRPALSATGGNTDIGITISPKGTGQVFITGSSPLRLATGVSPSNDDDAARKKYVDDRKVSFSVGFLISDPSSVTINGRDFGSFIVPAGGTYTFTQGKIMFKSGSHTAGGDLVFKIEQVGVGDKFSMGLNNSNNTVDTVYVDNPGDFTAGESAIFSAYLQARSGTITERNVMVVMEGFRTPF